MIFIIVVKYWPLFCPKRIFGIGQHGILMQDLRNVITK